MNDYNYTLAQKQYDNQVPERYNYKPVLKCSYCKEDICVGDEYFKVADRIYCGDCAEVKTLYADYIEDEVIS